MRVEVVGALQGALHNAHRECRTQVLAQLSCH